MDNLRWGVIGFGEAGSLFARHISSQLSEPIQVTDPLLNQVPPPAHIRQRLTNLPIKVVRDIGLLISSSDIVLSLVTPGVAYEVAREAGPAWHQGLYIDLNSVSPTEKREMASFFPANAYVDGAVLGSISGTGINTSLALAGPYSDEANTQMRAIGLKTLVISEEVGAASALKMSRSIFMKGIECLLLETLLASAQFNITESVLGSIDETITSYGMRPMVKMLVTTHAVHCGRRAEEMQHVSDMLRRLGMPHLLTDAAKEFLTASSRAGLTEHFNTTVPDDPEDVIKYLIHSYINAQESA